MPIYIADRPNLANPGQIRSPADPGYLPGRTLLDPAAGQSTRRAEWRAYGRACLDVARLTAEQAERCDAWCDAWTAMELARLAGITAALHAADAPRKSTERAVLAASRLRGTASGSAWAVRFGGPSVSTDMARKWGKYGPIFESHITITVPEDWLSSVHAVGLADVDGVLTLAASEILPTPAGLDRAWAATWAHQGRGCQTSAERGVIVERAGVRLHAPDLASGVRTLARRLGPQSQPRARRVTLAVARRCGLCQAGALAWAVRNLTEAEISRGWVTVERFREVAAVTDDQPSLVSRVLAAVSV